MNEIVSLGFTFKSNHNDLPLYAVNLANKVGGVKPIFYKGYCQKLGEWLEASAFK